MKFIALSGVEEFVLGLLIRHGDMFCLQMVDASDKRLKRGTIYVTIGRMEAKGFLTSQQEKRPQTNPGHARRVCQVTDYGRSIFEAWQVARAHLSARSAS